MRCELSKRLHILLAGATGASEIVKAAETPMK
jgi:hypothetical protein